MPKFILLTLANGESKAIVRTDIVGFTMRIKDQDENGKEVFFTRIFPKDFKISDDSNWIDVVETPGEIMKLLSK